MFSQNKSILKIHERDSLFNNKLRLKKSLSDSIEAKIVINAYVESLNSKGYLNAIIDNISFKNSEIDVFVKKGELYKWGVIKIDSTYFFNLSKIGVKQSLFENKTIYYKKYFKAVKKIVNYYENNGYPFVNVSLNNLKISNNIFNGKLKIEKGQQFKIDSINIIGDSKISSKYLQSFLGLKKGKLYNEEMISNIENKLNKLVFLNISKKPIVSFRENSADVNLFLKNKKANQFNGILGFLPNEKTTGKLLITGELNLFLINSFNQGEKIAFEWHKTNTLTQDIKAKADYKYIFSLPIGLDEDFKLYKKDTSYITIHNKTGIQLLLNGGNYIKLFYDNKNSYVIKNKSYITLADNLSNYTISMGGSGIYYEKLDYIYNPRKGYIVDFNISAGQRKFKQLISEIQSEYETTGKIESNIDVSYYKKITQNSVIKLRNNSALMYNYFQNDFNNIFYENELLKIGGLKSLRGFDEESINVSAFSIFSMELRYLFETNSAIYAFADGGYYEKNTPSEYINDTPIGFGAGIDFETKAGIFTINYALGKQFSNPIDLRASKIHFGIINRF
ncbi:MAG: hypothetical protein A2033_16465 [Bacteroidetes bacterium GWA2_31_9]|nr:MAG: hypothetical protein A2033_16465 [Bacteroidetes bacterium GWA2_31_9]